MLTLFCRKLLKPNQHYSQNLGEFRTLSGEYALLAAATNVVTLVSVDFGFVLLSTVVKDIVTSML
jgi:hypothetical protein